jgi:aspartyl-tRNA synthetase
MQRPQPNQYRDSWCGEIDAADVGRDVRVAGWVHRRRDHGGLIFIDLRDRSGVLQIVFHPERGAELFALAEQLRPEHVVSVSGELLARSAENINPEMATGAVELGVSEGRSLASSHTPPFPIDEDGPVDETTRLRYRWLDLRRGGMQQTMITRALITQTLREQLVERDFLEIETPILTKSTPEGARDFLVPSRMNPGNWYALPQSPQLFKQLLMMGGYERYFQIARCFRDEDLRADRQPEFTQLDVEMAFVDEDQVIEVSEAAIAAVFEATNFSIASAPWPRIGYDEAMLRFGSDRPDLRFGLEIKDVSGPGSTGGSFSISPTVSGPFAIALKAANAFSLYYYDSSVTNVASLIYSTAGTAVNNNGKLQNLSHATLYQPVPEPETYAMMLAGLAGLGFIARRRKQA